MGPIIIFDKSAFQSLSWEEHVFADIYFLQNLPPILPFELLGDLAKRYRAGRVGEREVATLARKFGGSGPAVNVDYREACIANLLGFEIPLTGQILASGAREVEAADGRRGAIIDLTPINEALLRWSKGEFSDAERLISGAWRESTRNLSMNNLRHRLTELRVILPRANSLIDASSIVDGLINKSSLQDVWFAFMLEQLRPGSANAAQIGLRWKTRSGECLVDFAPYAQFCLRALLLLLIADREGLVKRKSTNLIDLQYLYYAPFCMVFCSDDGLHSALAPFLLRTDQSFVSGRALKAGLRRLIEERSRVNGEKRHKLGSYPSPADGCAVYELWKKHCGPPRPENEQALEELSESQRQELMERVQAICDQFDRGQPR